MLALTDQHAWMASLVSRPIQGMCRENTMPSVPNKNTSENLLHPALDYQAALEGFCWTYSCLLSFFYERVRKTAHSPRHLPRIALLFHYQRPWRCIYCQLSLQRHHAYAPDARTCSCLLICTNPLTSNACKPCYSCLLHFLAPSRVEA